MLSYQHIYHAGNAADVHKHAALSWCLARMVEKPKPLTYVETHAGRGLYRLDAPEAIKTAEAAAGIGRIEGRMPADHPLRRVLDRVRAAHGASAYPGSPLLAAEILRPEDRMHLAEMHPRELPPLRALLGRRARILGEDGLAMALALAPPDPGRGLCLVDPSYEVKTDYAAIAAFVKKLHRKWPVGVVIVWYPLLSGDPHRTLTDALAAIPGGLFHEVRFPPARPGHRMTGSGLFLLNAPWGFDAEARAIAEWFAP